MTITTAYTVRRTVPGETLLTRASRGTDASSHIASRRSGCAAIRLARASPGEQAVASTHQALVRVGVIRIVIG